MSKSCDSIILLEQTIKDLRTNPTSFNRNLLERNLVALCGTHPNLSWLREHDLEEDFQIVERGFLEKPVVDLLKNLHELLCYLLEDPTIGEFHSKQAVLLALFDVSFVLRSECDTSSVDDQTHIADRYSDFNLIGKAIKILSSNSALFSLQRKSCYLYVLLECIRNVGYHPPTMESYLEVFSKYLDSVIPASKIEGLVAITDTEEFRDKVSSLVLESKTAFALPELGLSDQKLLLLLAGCLTHEYRNLGFSGPQDDGGSKRVSDIDEKKAGERVLVRKITFQVGLFFLLQHRRLLEAESLSSLLDQCSISWLFKFISHLAKIWPEDEICQAFTQQLLVHSALFSFTLRGNDRSSPSYPLVIFEDMFDDHIDELENTNTFFEDLDDEEEFYEDTELRDKMLKEYQSTFWKPIAKLFADGFNHWFDFFVDTASADPAVIIFFTFLCRSDVWPGPCRPHIVCESEEKAVSSVTYGRRLLFYQHPRKSRFLKSVPSSYDFFRRASEFICHENPLIRARSIDIFFSSHELAVSPNLELLETRLTSEDNLYLVAKLCRSQYFSACSTTVIEKCFARYRPLWRRIYNTLTTEKDSPNHENLVSLEVLTSCAKTLLSPRHSKRGTLNAKARGVLLWFIPFVIKREKHNQIDGWGFYGQSVHCILNNLRASLQHYSDQTSSEFVQDSWEVSARSLLSLFAAINHRDQTKKFCTNDSYNIPGILVSVVDLFSRLPCSILKDLHQSEKLGAIVDFCNVIFETTLNVLFEGNSSKIEQTLRLLEICLRMTHLVGSGAAKGKWFNFTVMGDFLHACIILAGGTNEVSSNWPFAALLSALGSWIEIRKHSVVFPESQRGEVLSHFEGFRLLLNWRVQVGSDMRCHVHGLHVRGYFLFLSWISSERILEMYKELPPKPLRPLVSPKVSGPIPQSDRKACCDLIPTVRSLIESDSSRGKKHARRFDKTVTFGHFLPEFKTELEQSIRDRLQTTERETIYTPEQYPKRSIDCTLTHFTCFCRALPHAAPHSPTESDGDASDLDWLHASLHSFWNAELRFVKSLTAAEFTAAVDFVTTYLTMHKIEPDDYTKNHPHYESVESQFRDAGIEPLYYDFLEGNNYARVIISILRMILRELNHLMDFEGSCLHNWSLFLPSGETDNGERIVQIFWTFPESPFFENLYYPFMYDVKKECIGNLVLETLIKLQQRPPADLDAFFTYFEKDREITLPKALQKVAKGLWKDFTKENAVKWRKYFVEKKVAVCQGCKALCEPEMHFEADQKRFCGVCSKEGYHQIMYWCEFCEGGICEDCLPEEFKHDEGFKKFDPRDSHGGARHPHVVSFEVKGDDKGETELPPQKRQRLE